MNFKCPFKCVIRQNEHVIFFLFDDRMRSLSHLIAMLQNKLFEDQTTEYFIFFNFKYLLIRKEHKISLWNVIKYSIYIDRPSEVFFFSFKHFMKNPQQFKLLIVK